MGGSWIRQSGVGSRACLSKPDARPPRKMKPEKPAKVAKKAVATKSTGKASKSTSKKKDA